MHFIADMTPFLFRILKVRYCDLNIFCVVIKSNEKTPKPAKISTTSIACVTKG